MASLKNKSSRVAYADWIRVMAAAMVVMIHTAAPILYVAPVGGADWLIAAVLDCVSHAAVPLFVMVSGMFMLDEGRQLSIRRAVTKYALPLVGLYFFWSFIYALANKVLQPLLVEGAAFTGAMVKAFAVAVMEGAYHLWYLPMLATVYLLAPLLRRFVSRANPRPALYFVLVMGVLDFLLPTGIALLRGFGVCDFTKAYASFFPLSGLVYPAYFVAGWLLANYRPSVKHRAAVYTAGAAALGLMCVLTAVLSVKAGDIEPAMLETDSLLCAVYAAALFAVFSWEGRQWQAPRWLSGLSGLTFGVYILHAEVQALYKQVLPYEGGAFGYIAVQWAVVTVLSLAAAWVVLRLPLIKKTLRG